MRRKGISLVALVITIVVLVILTGTVIITTIDSNIMGNTQTTVDMYNKKVIIEDINVKIQTKRLKKTNQGLYTLPIEEIIPIIEEYGIFDNDTLKLTTNTTKKEMNVWLYEIIDVPLDEYATIAYNNNVLTVETQLVNSGYIVQYSIDGGISWNKYTNEVRVQEESGIYIRLTNEEGRIVSNMIKVTAEGSEVIDNISPIVEIVASTTDITNVNSIIYTIRFSEPVKEFTTEDIQVENGTKGTFSKVNDMQYTIVVTNGTDCIQTITIPQGVCTDMAGNRNEAGNKSININRTVPVVTISPNGTSGANDINIVITASGVNPLKTDNEYEYCLTTNEVLDGTETWLSYTSGEEFKIGTNLNDTYYIHTKVIYDIAQNYSAEVTSNPFVFDNTQPTCLITCDKSSPTNASTLTYTIEFSEEVTGFTMDDIQVTNGTKATLQGSGTTYTLTVTTTENQNNTQSVSVLAGKCVDKAQNSNTASNVVSIQILRIVCPTDGSYYALKGVNSPKLVSGMTAVYWNGTSEVTSTNPGNDPNFDYNQWYDYKAQTETTEMGGTSKWANAKTADGSYWVWIPRYAYSIKSGYHTNTAGVIDIEFLKDKTNVSTTGRTSWNNASGQGNWNIQPAFSFKDSSNNSVELSGIWMSKFLMSRNDSTIISVGSNNIFSSKPNKLALSHDLTGDVYTWGINYNSTLKSHLIKSTEWGAVAYLAHSKYGRNGTVVSMNRCTTSISGAGPTAHNSTTTYAYNANNFGNTYSYLSTNGKLSSTTGNIYGVYDMSGKTQHTASYINYSSYLTNYAASLANGLAEYKVVYPKTGGVDNVSIFNAAKSMYGDSMYEIASGSYGNYAWFEQFITAAGGSDPIFTKGNSGLFGTHWYRPQPGYAHAHVRFVLWCN